jgi:hypothetical protein
MLFGFRFPFIHKPLELAPRVHVVMVLEGCQQAWEPLCERLHVASGPVCVTDNHAVVSAYVRHRCMHSPVWSNQGLGKRLPSQNEAAYTSSLRPHTM